MTTGFIARADKFGVASLAALFALLLALNAHAADVGVMGLFNGKAVLVINGGKPRTLNVGESAEGVKLISANSETALVEFEGKRQTVSMGSGTRIGGGSAASGGNQAMLTADTRGHFFANGSINGVPMRFMVDTGASTISLSTAQAVRLGINYLAGTRGINATANGNVVVYRVKLDNV